MVNLQGKGGLWVVIEVSGLEMLLQAAELEAVPLKGDCQGGDGEEKFTVLQSIFSYCRPAENQWEITRSFERRQHLNVEMWKEH